MPLPTLARLVLALALVAASAVAAAGADWPALGGGGAHEGVVDGPEPPYRRTWTAELTDAGRVAGPVVAGELVFVVADRAVLARSAEDGAAVWDVEREPGPPLPPAVTGEALVYAEGRGPTTVVRAVSAADGEELWGHATGAAIAGAPTPAEPNVIVAGSDGIVRALDLETGQETWSFRVVGRGSGAPAVADGMVFVVSEDLTDGRARVYGLDASTGAKRWEFSPRGPALGASSVSVGGGLAVVGLGDFAVHALDAATGKERWAADSRAAFSPAAAPSLPGDVVLGDRGGHVYRLDARTGDEGWTFRVSGDLLEGSQVVAGGAVVVGDAAGQASAIDLDTGRLVWRGDLGGPLGMVAGDGDRLYLAADGGSVTALEHDPDGTLLDEASPTTLYPSRALLNYAFAFTGVLGGLVAAFRGLRRRAARREGQS